MINQTLTAAYKFHVPVDIPELQSVVSKEMGDWKVRDKEYFGDYLIHQKKDTGTVMRIFKLNDAFAFDMLNKQGVSEKNWNKEIKELKDVLTKAGANDFQPTENMY